MIDRHTHIFGTAVVENSQQVLENWEDLKKREKGFKTHPGAERYTCRASCSCQELQSTGESCYGGI